MEDWKTILDWFEEDPEKIEEPDRVIYAHYDNGGYDGSAEVLFVDAGKFYYVSGSHCSCYGLDGQWSPEEYSVEQLRGQVERATSGFFKDRKDLIMTAIEQHSSPLADLALRYSQVTNALAVMTEQYGQLAEQINKLEDEEKRLADAMREMLKPK